MARDLVFTREVDEASSDGALYVVKLDGSGLRKITSGDLYPGDADWSPDGTEIVFEASDPQTPFGGVWIVGSDGSELRNVTATASGVGALDGFSDPVWSPDGSLILVLHGVHPDADEDRRGPRNDPPRRHRTAVHRRRARRRTSSRLEYERVLTPASDIVWLRALRVDPVERKMSSRRFAIFGPAPSSSCLK